MVDLGFEALKGWPDFCFWSVGRPSNHPSQEFNGLIWAQPGLSSGWRVGGDGKLCGLKMVLCYVACLKGLGVSVAALRGCLLSLALSFVFQALRSQRAML